ncbi:MAG: 2,3-diaminopropionate biosynthesis protein SbnB [bacterium]|nr:2,3-diaminopropionate biosynthesis protein SbnB [bacterium]
MLYLNDQDISTLSADWKSNLSCITRALELMQAGDFVQPIKPYLRYRDQNNRIIAMPAFIGGDINTAGLKWIASFPENIKKELPRAHCVIILNEAETGVLKAMICSGKINAVRTASVSGVMIQAFLKVRPKQSLRVGVIGVGPIGKTHLEMIEVMFGNQVQEYLVFDLIRPQVENLPGAVQNRTKICGSWKEVYQSSDIFITCTVSKERYIDQAPQPGQLIINVSLRDFQPQSVKDTQVIVDDWEEVYRENTDIEAMVTAGLLTQSSTMSLTDATLGGAIDAIPKSMSIFFNPMGMGIFDLAIAEKCYQAALREGIGVHLAL